MGFRIGAAVRRPVATIGVIAELLVIDGRLGHRREDDARG